MGRQVGVRCDRKLGDQQEVGGEEKSLQRQLWEIEKFASVDPVFRERQNKMWKEDLQEIERKRPELVLEPLKMQRRSQKAADSEEEVQMLNEEMEERMALYGGVLPGFIHRRSQETVGRQQLSWKLRSSAAGGRRMKRQQCELFGLI